MCCNRLPHRERPVRVNFSVSNEPPAPASVPARVGIGQYTLLCVCRIPSREGVRVSMQLNELEFRQDSCLAFAKSVFGVVLVAKPKKRS